MTNRELLAEDLKALLAELHEDVQYLVQQVGELEPESDSEALLTREEAADQLRISTRTLDDMAEAGEIQPVRIRSRVLYHPKTLEAYVQRHAGEGRRNE